MIFDKRNQHTRGCNDRVVQGVGKLGLAVVILVTDRQTSCLRVRQVGARANLKILLLSGAPSLNVAALILQIRQVTRAAAKLSYGDIQGAEKLYGVAPKLFVPSIQAIPKCANLRCVLRYHRTFNIEK